MIESFEQLLKFNELLRQRQLTRTSFVAPDFATFRFKLGTSLAETKVPFTIERAFRETLQNALDTLFLAIPMRHRDAIGPADLDAVLLHPAALNINLRPEMWYTGDVPPDSIYARILSRCMRQSRLLDAGLLLGWMNKDAPGRKLINELKRYVQKLDQESRERGQGEDTFRLGTLALFAFWSNYRNSISDRSASPFIQETYNATAIVHYELWRTVVEEHFRPSGLPERGIEDATAAQYHATMLPLSPMAIASRHTHFGADPINPFGLSSASLDALERFFPRMLERATPPAEVAKQIATRLAADKTAPRIVFRDLRQQTIYHTMLPLLGKIKAPDPASSEGKLVAELHRIRKDLDGFVKTLDDKKAFKEWSDLWKSLTIDALKPQMDEFLAAVQHCGKLSEGFLADKATLERAYTERAQRFVLYRHAEALHAAWLTQLAVFQEQSGERERIEAEYAAGRLYRIAADDTPLLQTATGLQEAHLFIDLKDFTKRTFSSKEVAMADFMKWEFYEPIIKAAKEFTVDMAHIDRGSISINNLLGDAVAASGNIGAILKFAHAILELTFTYRDKLKAKIPPDVLAAKLKAAEAEFAAGKRALEQERARYLEPAQKLNAELKALPPTDPRRTQLAAQLRGYQEAIGAIDRQLRQLAIDLADAKGAIEGSGLEAGGYIAFGAAPETIVLKDDVFGTLKVAIGEKINESARGTARDSAVRDRLEHLLAKARAASRNPEMDYPFKVFVDNTLQFTLDADHEEQLRQAIQTRDPEAAKRVVAAYSQRIVNDLVPNLKKNNPEFRAVRQGNGIYNLGLAVSGEALDAYLNSLGGSRLILRRELVPQQDLHEEIKRRFVFPREHYAMVIVAPAEPGSMVEIFVELGSMVFKGFEKRPPQPVWEMLNPRLPFYKALQKHHLGPWLQASAGT